MPDFSLEQELHSQGFPLVAGVDEVGRGPLAGPVVAAAVVFSPDLDCSEPWTSHLDDSKKLSPRQRSYAVELVETHALAIGVAQIAPGEIDRVGIGPACINAMLEAVARLPLDPSYLLLDYVPIRECRFPFQTIVGGDGLSLSIAAASIVAKVARDRLMREAHDRLPRLCLRPQQRLRHGPTPGPVAQTPWTLPHPPALLQTGPRSGQGGG